MKPRDRIRQMRFTRKRATTPRALMIEAIGEKLQAEEAREALLAEAKVRLARMKSAGAAIPATAVFSYLEERARGLVAARPRARKLT